MSQQHHRLIVLGSGPAGYTAALYAARANLKPALITGIEVGGQLTTTTEVENWPGGHSELQGPELMQQMAEHVSRFDAVLVNDHIHTATVNSTQPDMLTMRMTSPVASAMAPIVSSPPDQSHSASPVTETSSSPFIV